MGHFMGRLAGQVVGPAVGHGNYISTSSNIVTGAILLGRNRVMVYSLLARYSAEI